MNQRPDHAEVQEATEATARSMTPQRVPINAYEAPEAFVILALVPAVTPDDVTVELDGDTVRLWAELRSSGPREMTIREWEYGGYERTVDVPDGYGSDVEATMANGQLAIRVLKGDPPADPRRIHPNGH